MINLIIVVIIGSFGECQGANGVIWNKLKDDFVPISSIPSFLAMQEVALARTRILEVHNFHRAPIRLTYYQERYITDFYDDNTKVTGLVGEIWNTLAEHLNFTLVVRRTDTYLGMQTENGSFSGLLGILGRNEVDVVPRVQTYTVRLEVLDFSMAFWKTRYRLYIRPQWKNDVTWMFTVFRWEVWTVVITLFLIFGMISFMFHTTTDRRPQSKQGYSLGDHLLFTFSMMCNQGNVLPALKRKSKALDVTISFFAWLILLAFSSHLISNMTNRTFIPPFTDLESLTKSTKYNVIIPGGTFPYIVFKKREKPIYNTMQEKNRVLFLDNVTEIYHKVCFSKKKKYAVFESELIKLARGRTCPLNPTGIHYFETWVASGIIKGFKYKRSIDVSIIKLHEVGIMDVLMDRWLQVKYQEDSGKDKIISVDMSQVHLVFVIWFVGVVISLIIVFIEIMSARWSR
ncbi:uncharacterized protein LOC105703649 [Orussus abietinus]|uniref:uncharacterized protein LOC105703649 n=1 Tax=Orussus abietinus TaxID=222816 RepID=UPI00062604E4|nr:uncharacterized protein LOC105703649 [Orussus abietinus]